MSLAHAILGLLAEQPMTGYDLKTAWFDRTIAHFWAADHAQIYRTLDKLAEQGLVAVEVEPNADRPPRKVYRLTADGHSELLSWLRTPQPAAPVRDVLQIQIFCGAPLTNAELTKLLDAERATQERRRKTYQAQLAAAETNGSAVRSTQLRLLTLRRGIQRAEGALAWIEEACATIAALPEDSNGAS